MGHGMARSYPSSRGAQLLPGHLPSASAAHLVSCLSSLLVSRVSAPNLRLPPSSSPHPQLVTPPASPGKQALEGGTTPVTPATPYTGRPPSPPPPLSGPSSANFSGPFSRFILSLALSVDSSHQHLTYSFSLVLRNKIKTLLSPTPAGLRPAPHRLFPEPLPADELGAGRSRPLWFVTS